MNMLVNLANPGLVISVSTACRYIDNMSLVPEPGVGDADDDDDERLGGDPGVDEDSGPSPRPPHRARGQGRKEGAASLRLGCSPVRPTVPRREEGRWRPPEEPRGPRPPAGSRGGLEEAPQPLLQRRVGRGTASGRKPRRCSVHSCDCHLHHPGVCGHIMTNRRRISTTRGRSSSARPSACPPSSTRSSRISSPTLGRSFLAAPM